MYRCVQKVDLFIRNLRCELDRVMACIQMVNKLIQRWSAILSNDKDVANVPLPSQWLWVVGIYMLLFKRIHEVNGIVGCHFGTHGCASHLQIVFT